VGVERLELSVPNLRFPFDSAGGAAHFQSRRCDFDTAVLRVDAARLQSWLLARPRLPRLGITQPRVRLVPGRIELSARARVGDRTAPVTAKVRVAPAGEQRLLVRIDDVRLYGFLPVP